MIAEYFGKTNKKIVLSIIVGILLIISYMHIGNANNTINQRLNSYSPVKEAGIWIKENSQAGDIVLTQSQTQMAYYSQRKIRQFYNNESETFDQYINQSKPKFLTWSMFEYHPEWVIPWIQKNEHRLKAVHVLFADQTKQQPMIVVYEVIYE